MQHVARESAEIEGVECYSDASGCLHIDFSATLGFQCHVTVWPWQDGMTRQLMVDGETEVATWHDSSGLELGAFALPHQPWFQTIPSELHAPLLDFDSKAPELTFSLLWLISRHRAVRDLFMSAPMILVGLILLITRSNHWNETDVVWLCGQKRRDILQTLGLPAQPSVLNFMGKLECEHLEMAIYAQLLKLFHQPQWKRLNHWAHVPMDVLFLANVLVGGVNSFLLPYCKDSALAKRILQCHQELPDSRLVERYCARGASLFEFHELIRMTRDTQRMLANNPVRLRRVLQCRSFEELRQIHDRAVDEQRGMCAQGLEAYNAKRDGSIWKWRMKRVKYALQRWRQFVVRHIQALPKPPLAAGLGIRLIRSYRQLLREGSEMRHCVVWYYSRLMCGSYFLYQMRSPERLTIGILKQGKHLKLDQIKGERNARPSDESVIRVEQWFMTEMAKVGKLQR